MAKRTIIEERDGVRYAIPTGSELPRINQRVNVLERADQLFYEEPNKRRANVDIQLNLSNRRIQAEEIAADIEAQNPGLSEYNAPEFKRLLRERLAAAGEASRQQNLFVPQAKESLDRLLAQGGGYPSDVHIPTGDTRKLMQKGIAPLPPRAPNAFVDPGYEHVFGEQKPFWKTLLDTGLNLGNKATIPLNLTSVVNAPRLSEVKQAQRIEQDYGQPYNLESYLALSDELEQARNTKIPKEAPIPPAGASFDYVPQDYEVSKSVPKKTKLGVSKEAWEQAESQGYDEGTLWESTKQLAGTGFIGEGQYSDEVKTRSHALYKNAQDIAWSLSKDDPNITDEHFEELTDTIYRDMLSVDESQQSMESPVLSQVGPEMLADTAIAPLGVGKAILKGARAVGKTPVGEPFKRTYRSLFDKQGISRPDVLEAAGYAEDVIDPVSEAQRATTSKALTSADRVHELTRAQAGLSKRLSEDGQQKYLAIDEAMDRAAKVNIYNSMSPADKQVFDQMLQLNDQLFTLKSELGMTRQINDAGKLVEAPEVFGFMPRYAKEGAKVADPSAVRVRGKKGELIVDPKSGHERIGSRSEGQWSPDIEAQWKAASSVEGREAAMASAISNMAPVLAERGLLYSDKATGLPMVKSLNAEDIGKAVSELSENTGMQWQALSPAESQIWKKVLGNVGDTIVGEGSMILPKQQIDHIQTIMPALSTTAKTEFANAATQGMKKYMGWWKGGKTLGGLGGFVMTNLYGSTQLGLAGQGVKFLKPQVQAQAALTAIDGAMKRQTKGLTKSLTLSSGETVPTQTLAKMMIDYGVIRQGGGRIGRVAGQDLTWMEKGFDKIGMTTAVSATDDWFHATAFLGALKSTHPQDVFKAVNTANELTGNYKLLTESEKFISNHVLPFYSFQGYAAKFFVKQSLENPAMLKQQGNVAQGYEQSMGGEGPASFHARQDFTSTNLTYPWQPEDPDSPYVVTMRPDSPWSVMADTDFGSPAVNLLVAAKSGIDPQTGHPTQPVEETFNNIVAIMQADESLNPKAKAVLFEMSRSPALKFAIEPILTPSLNASALYTTLVEEYGLEVAQDVAAQMAVSRVTAGFDGIFREISRAMGVKVPSQAVSTMPFSPKTYITDTAKTLKNTQSQQGIK